MRVTLFKEGKRISTFRKSAEPFLDILSVDYSGETELVTVRFSDETNNGNPQITTFQYGADFDCLLISKD